MNRPVPRWMCCGRPLAAGDTPLLMGIVNVTPDSFSDGGRHSSPPDAVEWGLQLVEDGADIVDVGGESTRPGAAPVPVEEELRRVIPVIRGIRQRCDAVLSVDTTKAEVARRAVEAGARIVNDVSAMTADPGMVEVVRATGAGVVLMHMRGTPRTMQCDPQYDDVVDDVLRYLRERIAALTAEGVSHESLAVDPGIGFGKTLEHNLALLRNAGRLRDLARPVVVGLSRKSWIGRLTGRDVGGRLAGSLAGLAHCASLGVDVMRVHDVRESRDVLRVLTALSGAQTARPADEPEAREGRA